MSAALITFSIIAYILSLVASLLILLMNKQDEIRWIKVFLAVHFAFLLLSLLFHDKMKSWMFLLFFCSGIILFGLSVRSSLNKFVKGYLLLFILSFAVFLYSPSRLLSWITWTGTSSFEKEMNLTANIFLMKQQGMIDNPAVAKYKLFKKLGIFNKTLARDIDFGHRIDSAKMISLLKDSSILIRGYFSRENNGADSLEIRVQLGMNQDKNVFLKPSKK